MTGPCCAMQSTIERHFRGEIRPDDERELRRHLESCEACRRSYERRRAASRFMPNSVDARTRIGIGLGILPAKKRIRVPMAAALGATAALALLICLGVQPWSGGGFVPRGTKSGALVHNAPARLVVFRMGAGNGAFVAGEEIAADDELAFAYENRAGKKWLLVFGVDDLGHVYWYHPGWQDASRNPGAVSIRRDLGVYELEAAVTHEIRGASLTIHGVFSDQPLSVKQVEQVVRRAEPGGDLPIPGTVQVRHLFAVRH